MKTKGIIAEFKEFALKGSIIDIAVGMIVGAAFTAIVTSLVNDIVMPLIGIILGKVDFTSLCVTVGSAKVMYGSFIQACLNFFLVALVIFICIKSINNLRNKMSKQEETEEEAPQPAEDVVLLREIRDLLKNQK